MFKAIWHFILRLLGIHIESPKQKALNKKITKTQEELDALEEKHDMLENKGVAEKALEDEIKYWESK